MCVPPTQHSAEHFQTLFLTRPCFVTGFATVLTVKGTLCTLSFLKYPSMPGQSDALRSLSPSTGSLRLELVHHHQGSPSIISAKVTHEIRIQGLNVVFCLLLA